MTKNMMKVIGLLFLTIAVVLGGITLIYGKGLLKTRANESQALKIETFPEPRLEANPREGLAKLRSQENKTLSTYGQGQTPETGRVPIDRAMQEMAK